MMFMSLDKGCFVTDRFLFRNVIEQIWHRLGFVPYLHGLCLDSFQTTERHSYDGYFIYSTRQVSTNSFQKFTL